MINIEQLAALAPTRLSVRRAETDPHEPVPFFAREADTDSTRPRLLVLSYHFPPGTAVGALRWRKFVAYAVRRGYAVDVVTLHPASLGSRDEDGLKELPGCVRVFGVPPARSRLDDFLNRALAARRWLVQQFRTRRKQSIGGSNTRPSTDQRSFSWSEVRRLPRTIRELSRTYSSWLDHSTMREWARATAAVSVKLSQVREYRAIVTSGPPHMVHEAGRLAAEATGIPLILDFRDPWSLVQRVPEEFASRLWKYFAEKFERQVVACASLVVVNTQPHRNALQKLYPELRAPIITVTNGFDEEQLPPPARSSRFVIAYAGSIYLDRNPRALFRAAAQVIRECRLTPDQFALAFMGGVDSLDGVTLREMAQAEGVSAYLKLRPSGSRSAALQFLSEASMLVSLPQDSDMAIPSKVFEYMCFNAWLLALAAPHSATAQLLQQTAADVIAPDDEVGLTNVIRARYEQHACGVVPPRIADDHRFGRQQQARLLFDSIERILDHDCGAAEADRPSALVQRATRIAPSNCGGQSADSSRYAAPPAATNG